MPSQLFALGKRAVKRRAVVKVFLRNAQLAWEVFLKNLQDFPRIGGELFSLIGNVDSAVDFEETSMQVQAVHWNANLVKAPLRSEGYVPLRLDSKTLEKFNTE